MDRRARVGLVAGVATTACAAAMAATAPVAPELRAALPRLKARTTIAVLLPSYFPYARASARKLRAVGTARRSSWVVTLFYGRACGANACTIGFLEGQRGGSPGGFTQRVRLVRGVVATYKPTTCGGSCSPAEIDWRQAGVVYRYQLRVDAHGKAEKAAMVRMANSAIVAGAR